MPDPETTRSREPGGGHIGLALAGGGPAGAVYEIGALCALEEAVDGLTLDDLHVYVGVSAGAFVAACLANGISIRRLCRGTIIAEGDADHPFNAEMIFTPAFKELARRLATLPRLLAESVGDYAKSPADMGLLESLTRMLQGLPVGVFDNDVLRRYLADLFRRPGRTDDFRQLVRRLVIVASDLDAGRAVRFGEPPMDHIPISRAVQASAALPGLYPPVEIEGRHYVDGVLHKTLHASVALEAGAKLLFCVNPLVPIDTSRAVEMGVMDRGKLIDHGLPAVLSQSLRTMIRSRLQKGLDTYASQFEDADVVLLEPRPDDYRMFFTNIFSFSQRKKVAEHAYRRTRRNLLARHDELAPLFERHGLTLRRDVLADDSRDLATAAGLAPPHRPAEPAGRLLGRLDQSLDRLEELLGREEATAEPSRPAARGKLRLVG